MPVELEDDVDRDLVSLMRHLAETARLVRRLRAAARRHDNDYAITPDLAHDLAGIQWVTEQSAALIICQVPMNLVHNADALKVNHTR